MHGGEQRVKDLWDAIDDGAFDRFQEVLACRCVHLEEVDESGQTALHRALFIPNERMAIALIEAGMNVNAQDASLFSPLHFACRYQLMDVITLLLERGSDPNAAMYARERPISYSLLEDNVPLLELLISYGAEVNFIDDFGDTPLHIAAAYGAMENARFLIDRGANLTVRRNSGETPAERICACLEHDEREFIICADGLCTESDIRRMRTMFRQAQRSSSTVASNRVTELDLWNAVVGGTVEDVEEILDCNCTDPDSGEQIPNCKCVQLQAVTQTQSSDWNAGQTALHLAVLRKSLPICSLLIDREARADFRNSEGNTPLHLATRNNLTAIVELFLAQNISADSQNNEEQTALHIASRYGFLRITRRLVDYGASLKLNDEQGATPVEIVCSCLLTRDCPDGSCRDGEDIVDLMTTLNEEDEEDHQRVVQLFFPPHRVTTTTDDGSSSDEGDGASSLGAFIGALFACALVFFMFFAASMFIMKRRQAQEERAAQIAQILDQPATSGVQRVAF